MTQREAPPMSSGPQIAVVDLVSTDVAESARAYARLLGRAEPSNDVDVASTRVRLRPKDYGDHRVLLGNADADGHARLLGRRGLNVSSPNVSNPAAAAEPTREWHVEDLPFGVISAPVAHTDAAQTTGISPDISGIDHLVFQSPDRHHAVALFGATLGLDFRLDRRVVNGLRQLFFRHGELVIEVVVPDRPPADESVRLWGIAWRSNDIDATYRRLGESGVEVSQVRTGRKPGTRVATVDDDALATRTIIIASERAPERSAHSGSGEPTVRR